MAPQVEMRTEKAKLRRVMRRWDIALFSACAIIALDSVAYTTANGAGQALTWLAITLVLFFIPYGLLNTEVTAAIPAEGGLYVWCRMAFGKLVGETGATMYCLGQAIWVGGTSTAVTIGAINTFFFPDHPLNTTWSIVVGLIFTWTAVGLSVIQLNYGKWTGNFGTVLKTVLVAVFAVVVIGFLVKQGLPSGLAPSSSYAPSSTGFLAIVGVIVFLWVGFELPGSTGEEMINPQKDVPRAIFSSGVITAVLYAVVLAGMLLVVPLKDLTAAGGFSDAYNIAAGGVLGSAAKGVGYVIGIAIVVVYLLTAAVWIIGPARMVSVAALDGAAPLGLGKFTKQGTPANMCILMGLVGSAFCVLIFLVTSGSLMAFIGVMIALTTSLFVFDYLILIAAVVKLRYSRPDIRRPFVIPGGKAGLWVSAILCEFFCILTCITLLWPGLINNILGQSYSIVDSWGMSRLRYEVYTLGSFCFMVLIGVVFWAIGRRQTGETAGDALIQGVVEGTAPETPSVSQPAGVGV
jgi:glutamate:GABA antiporter